MKNKILLTCYFGVIIWAFRKLQHYIFPKFFEDYILSPILAFKFEGQIATLLFQSAYIAWHIFIPPFVVYLLSYPLLAKLQKINLLGSAVFGLVAALCDYPLSLGLAYPQFIVHMNGYLLNVLVYPLAFAIGYLLCNYLLVSKK